jgi:hypothetical protein
MVMGMSYCGGSASAAFSTSTFSGSTNCTTSTVGDCQVIDCPPGNSDAGSSFTGDGGTGAMLDSAGDITIAGSLVDGGITLTYANGLYHSSAPLTGRYFNGGATLTVSAAGATVPAFSGKSVTAPGDITITAPTCATSMCGTISASSDFNVTWTGTATTVRTTVISSKSGAGSATLFCNFASSPGTIGAAAMSKLRSGSGATNFISVVPVGTTTFNAGDYSVTFTASGTGTSGSFTPN